MIVSENILPSNELKIYQYKYISGIWQFDVFYQNILYYERNIVAITGDVKIDIDNNLCFLTCSYNVSCSAQFINNRIYTDSGPDVQSLYG